MVFKALRASLVFLALATSVAVAGEAAAATPGTYVGAGPDRQCVAFKVGEKSPDTLIGMRVGSCDWRFVCGSNGSRGAPGLYAQKVRLNKAGSFEIHRTSGGGGFQADQYWDVTGRVRGKRASGTFRFHYGPVCDTGVIQWNAELKRKLEADAGGPYNAHRGESLTLDGSRSKPRRRITSYRWRFSSADCPRVELGGGAGTAERVMPRVDAEREGAQPSIKPLCSITAILTVSDGMSTDTDRARVRVRERRWKKIGFAHAPRPAPFTGNLNGSTSCLECVFGKNVCRHEGDDAWIHPGPPDRAIERGGVKLGQVQDPNGPFDGMAYVRSTKLEISRLAQVNRLLYPGSELYRINKKAGRAKDVDALRESVADHERFHSELGRKALAGNDPTSALEGLVTENTDVLNAYVAARLSATDQALQTASSDSAVKKLMAPKWGKRSAKIKLPPAYNEYFVIHSLAKLGDERP